MNRSLRLIASAVVSMVALAACQQPSDRTSADGPDSPVRAYFAALAADDFEAAYALSRTSRDWLLADSLKVGYRAPTHFEILHVEYGFDDINQQVNDQIAYVRVRYRLADYDFESSVEVVRNAKSGLWAINSGSTGRLDVVSKDPRVRVANRVVVTDLAAPRDRSRYPRSGYFELPPGVYAVKPATGSGEALWVPVPAVWRDGWPVEVRLYQAGFPQATYPQAARSPGWNDPRPGRESSAWTTLRLPTD